ncbi:MAG: helix-turn-helix transcriptional regulator [Enterocloster asparagiformis]|nr:helix-turn-helix transcriptional regulator [Enterocloster asparagiformis]
MNTGELIRFYRKQRKLTQDELAKKCGTSAAMIRQYELGKRNPKIDTIDKIAQALNIHIADIYSFTLDEWKKTDEYKRHQRDGDSHYAVVKLLEIIFERAEIVSVDICDDKSDELICSSDYVSVGIGPKKKAIANTDFDTLVKLIENNLKEIAGLISEEEDAFLSSWEKEHPNAVLKCTEDEHVKLIIEDRNGNSHFPPF